MENLINSLKEEEAKLIEKLGTLTPGTADYANVVQDMNNLYTLLIGLDKQQHDKDFDEVKFIEELKQKENELTLEKKKHRFGIISSSITNIVTVAGIVLPLVCYGAWLQQGYKFEEEGVISSTTTKGLLGKIRPTK